MPEIAAAAAAAAAATDGNPSQAEDKTTAYLRRTYREYYFKHHDEVEVPKLIQNREFGYLPFGRGMVRHLSYKSSGELAADLVKQAPSSVYCSNGVYSNPTLPMDEKGWKGAELIFDIDASSIPTACRTRHSFWTCKDCGKVMRSAERPPQCSKCQGTNVVQLHWSCPECLAATKDHISRLLKFLTNDFGVLDADIAVYFSGNRGYHLHVDDKRFEGMDPSARAEVAKYIRGTALLRPHGSDETTAMVGWAQRTAELADDGGGGHPRPEQVANAFGSKIDEAVTTDIHRIFRMPGTLHGNSGLLKMRVHDLQAFRPEQDPVVLGDEEVALFVRGSPKFSLKGRTFEPYSAEEAELPTYAAVYLMTKGLARLAE